MIVTCRDCRTRYRFDESRVPAQGLLVRCLRCRTVFRLPAATDPKMESSRHDIERLARVVVSDLEAYHSQRLLSSIREGRFFEEFHANLEDARRLVRQRYPNAEALVADFDSALDTICDQRREPVN